MKTRNSRKEKISSSFSHSKPKWLEVLRALLNTRMLVIFFMGISSGLPFLLTGSTLQAWMTDEGINLTVIGIFSLVGLPYTLKFLWAPALDRFLPPLLGRRKGWALISQILLFFAILALGFSHPKESPFIVAILALCLTFFSATQDIVLDAYRREILPDNELGLGSSLFIVGYRLGMLASGAGGLFLADQMPWSWVYGILAFFMSIGVLTSLFAPEPPLNEKPPQSLEEAVVLPFLDFFKRPRPWEILLFIFLYKLGDTMAAAMSTPFLLELGFSKSQLAAYAKTLGLFATLGGGVLGGLIMVRLGINRSLWVFGFYQMLSTLCFVFLAKIGPDPLFFALTITIENSAAGMGTSAYAAYMAQLCNKRFTATQYALLSSFMGIPRVLAAAPSGFFAKTLGWPTFFFFCTLLAIPGMLLLLRVASFSSKSYKTTP